MKIINIKSETCVVTVQLRNLITKKLCIQISVKL